MISLQNYADSKQKSYEIMTMRTFATLDKAKPSIENTAGINLTAVKLTTVQVSKLLLLQSYVI
jgi:hypothetical protein